MTETKKVTRLRARVEEARQLRKLQMDASAAALKVERITFVCMTLMWVSIVGLSSYTMVNVQKFFAGDAKPWTAEWITAWLIDPMFVGLLIAALIAEQTMARWGVDGHGSITLLKWASLLVTYVLNTWHSWAIKDAAGVVQHSSVPIMIFVAAEAFPWLRDRMTRSVLAAAGLTEQSSGATAPETATGVATAPETATQAAPVAAPEQVEQISGATAPETATPEQVTVATAPEQVAPEVAPAADLVEVAEQSVAPVATAPETAAPEQVESNEAEQRSNPEQSTVATAPGVEQVEQPERSSGAVRSNVTDIAETAERDRKLCDLFERYPDLSDQKTADLFAELHGITVGRSTVNKIKRRWKIAKSA